MSLSLPKFLLLCALFVFCPLAVQAADLYRIDVENQGQADFLNNAKVTPLLRISGGYLVLSDQSTMAELDKGKISYSLSYKDVFLSELALDISKRPRDRSAYDVVFRDGDFVVYRIHPDMSRQNMADEYLMPVERHNLQFVYTEPYTAKSADDYPDDLLGLISLISQDTVQSYTETLQAFDGRLTGTASNYASRDWIYSKFVDFGYDSIYIDSFLYGTTECQNVVAYKTGTKMPNNYIVVCGHRDAVSGSPGADDNGSGTAGTLEIARVLADIDTDLSFAFILFDAEEQGLNGSWHYADAAAARGDSIEFVMNMDMIGDIDNSTLAKLYYGSEPGRAALWQELSDSLVGINGVFSGSISASDHHPFIQNGYEAILLIEYEFSDVYHTYQDSTTHMSFDYHTRMIKGSLATVYTIDQTAVPGPTLAFDYPDGYPETVVPNTTTEFEVVVSGLYDGVPVPGTGQLHYSINGGTWQTVAMAVTGQNRYTATLPAVTCADELRYYVSAEESTSGIINNPSSSTPRVPIVASDVITVFFDDFETEKFWSVSGGQWQRGAPSGGGGDHGYPDPSSAYSYNNVYGYNLSGDYGNNLPEYHLTTPALDCSDISGVTLSFQRWLGVEQPSYDHAYLRISNNGTRWTTLWQNTAEVDDNSWSEQVFDISAYADNQPTVYIRWTMGTTDVSWTYCGWNIDDVEVVGYQCEDTYEPPQIMTTSVPDGEMGTPYSNQLVCDGGMGILTWSDKNGDLAGTGLSLSATGMLSGTPVAAGDISFTAVVTDEMPNSDEQPLTVTIAQSYVCGDANGDDDINVADPVFVINYVFRGGPAPDPLESGDANCDGGINVGDAVHVINHVFNGGPAPCCP